MYHYTYEIINNIKKVSYVGRRSSYCLPEEDIGIEYFSSSTDKEFMSDQKKNRQNYTYKILGIFSSINLAIAYEIYLHDKYDVAKNPKYYNLAKQLVNGFCSGIGTNSVNAKPVLQINPTNGEIIKLWGCQTEAVKEVGVNKDSIRWCIEGKLKIAEGFVWLSPNDYNEKKKKEINDIDYSRTGINCYRSKSILQIDMITKEIIKVWVNTMVISDHFGINQSNFSACARGNRISSKGYFWVYEEDYEDWIQKRYKENNEHR